MENYGDIIERYRNAPEDERIYLFLDCPTLRNAFMEIDRSEALAKGSEVRLEEKQRRIKRSFFSKLSNCCGH